jgi:hypothetical protein
MNRRFLFQKNVQFKLTERLSSSCGDIGQWTQDLIHRKKIQIGCKRHGHGAAASWDVFNPRRIWLDDEYRDVGALSADQFAEMLSLIVHEAVHLDQPFFRRLTVIGELEAWQTGFRVFRQLAGRYPNALAARMMELPLQRHKSNISLTRQLMKQFNRAYLAEWLLPWDWQFFKIYLHKKH